VSIDTEAVCDMALGVRSQIRLSCFRGETVGWQAFFFAVDENGLT
jgi:hypothetical protein